MRKEGSKSRVLSSVRGTFSARRFYKPGITCTVLVRHIANSVSDRRSDRHVNIRAKKRMYLLCQRIFCLLLRKSQSPLQLRLALCLFILVRKLFTLDFVFYGGGLEAFRHFAN